MKKDQLNKNSLRQYRKRAGLDQKQVAFFLGKRSPDEITRYEVGSRRPNIETALKLAAIYQVPVRLLFHGLYERCRDEIAEQKRKHPQLLPDPYWSPKGPEQLRGEEFCFYANLLEGRIPNELELRLIDKHAVNLMKTSSPYRRIASS